MDPLHSPIYTILYTLRLYEKDFMRKREQNLKRMRISEIERGWCRDDYGVVDPNLLNYHSYNSDRTILVLLPHF